jgi:hypothetical protein
VRLPARRQNRAIERERLIDAMVAQVSLHLAIHHKDLSSQVAGNHEELLAAIEQIQPAHVDMTAELADQITLKLRGPLIIPDDMAAWVRDETRYQSVFNVHPIGYGGGFTAHWTFRPGGYIDLEMRNREGMAWWRGTFQPASDEAQAAGDD